MRPRAYPSTALLVLASTLLTGCGAVEWRPLTPESVVLMLTLAVVAWYTIETARLRRIEQQRLEDERERHRAQTDPEFGVRSRPQAKGPPFRVTLVNLGGPIYSVDIRSSDGEVDLQRRGEWLRNHPGWVMINPPGAKPKLSRFVFELEYENELSERRTKRFAYSTDADGKASVLGWTPRSERDIPVMERAFGRYRFLVLRREQKREEEAEAVAAA